jgi:hypothetical protein
LIPNPIHKVLSTLSSHAVRHLLMGGQACVFYGAAEFSRDCDIVIVADDENLARLAAAIQELEAVCIAVPPFERQYLERGHAVHFRCRHPGAKDIRLDVMTKLRGCDSFAELWQRRMTLQDVDGSTYEILGIVDLVKAKKTQRDKDWPMIRRLVDAHYDEYHEAPTREQVRFWLRESRTPAVLIALAASHPDVLRDVLPQRPLLCEAMGASESLLQRELDNEQARERAADQDYWQPLKKELQALRAVKRQRNEGG